MTERPLTDLERPGGDGAWSACSGLLPEETEGTTEHVDGVMTVGEFYALAAGGQIIST